MKFRKKPVVIEAEQFWANSAKGWPWGVYMEEGQFMIDTLEGQMHVSEGDWIITGVKGERYACKPDVFEMTYEAVEGTLGPLGRTDAASWFDGTSGSMPFAQWETQT